MVYFASIFWILGFVLSVVIAPQLRIWTWGPTMICLALSTGFSLFSIPKEERNKGDFTIIIIGVLLVFWLIMRASLSDVWELALSDILLTCMAASTFVTFRAVARYPQALRVIQVGLSLVTVASIYVAYRQVTTPGYSLIFPDIKSRWVSGLYAHYSYGASFFLTVSLIFFGFIFQPGEKKILRCVFTLLAGLSALCVFYTKSRGGILGFAGGFSVLVIYLLLAAKRDNRRWFAPAVIAIPIILGGIILALVVGWENAQQSRSQDSSLSALFDNTIRFYLLAIATSCFFLHPLLGGGARSFSWESFRFWDYDSMGPGSAKPEHVHNELLQTFVEYGAIGGFLLLAFLLITVIIATFRVISKSPRPESMRMDGWRIGGIAGFAGLFIQSNFEGIFRIPPGAILLALCIAAACSTSQATNDSPNSGKPWFVMSLLSLVGLFSISLLGYSGVKGTRTSIILWNSFFGFTPLGKEAKIDAVSNAIEIWPLFSLYQHRAILYQQASSTASDPKIAQDFLKLSLNDFSRASVLHPYDPTSSLGEATLLGILGRESEAETEFSRAIRLQGGMEAGFKSHLSFAKYLNRKGLSQFSRGQHSEALVTFELAYHHISKAFETSWLIRNDQKNHGLRIAIIQNFAQALEESGEYRRAMGLYDLSVKLPYGTSSHYRAAVLYGDLAVETWSERNGADALALFLKAKQRLRAARVLPQGVSEKKRVEWSAYLDQSIRYLQAAKFKPSEKVDF
jgi:O-antigen ligase/tetratricopeptide (TPR) repeat protein